MEGWQVSFTCTLACRQGAHFCLCRDRRISVTLNLHKSRAISQRLASSVGIRYTNKVFEQDSARNYCLLVQHNSTCRVRVDPGNDGVGPVVWSALMMTGCCKTVTSVQSQNLMRKAADSHTTFCPLPGKLPSPLPIQTMGCQVGCSAAQAPLSSWMSEYS